MKELLKHGLYVDSTDRHGLTAIQVATDENHMDMVKFLLMNGSEVNEIVRNKISSVNLNEMLQKREVGHRIAMPDTLNENALGVNGNGQQSNESKEQGQKFGFDATNALLTNEEGAEIDSIEVIRDNDKLFIIENPDSIM
ncbi:UNVERIFIED_CONTAM: Potassium channel AKT2/3 [Sesamum angustifolium]|uniref:Potassium channel AKT2/3 n=1 Tax=Sesamum angustifolium TaxID=2727405 RepID=A0AAW2QB54_9LAMI